jgi:molecular chaperone DnaK
LSDAEIQQMVRDAEAHKGEDEARREIVMARNQADALIHQARKSINDMGENIDAGEKASIENSIDDLERIIKDDNASKAQIEEKIKALTEKSHKLAEAVYAKSAGNEKPASKAKDDDIIDAEVD